jgi:Transglutaminase-like superfamily
VTVELQWWPCSRPILPLDLFRLNSVGEAMLTARLPRRQPTALATAEMVLDWVTSKWQAGGSAYTQDEDANRVLDRATAGARYGATEYTIVLTQALNALRIPARRLRGLPEGYEAATGTAHPMTEAWIDDLGGWVLFDGRNGATWRDPAGTPLGAVDLQRLYRAKERPEFCGTGQNFQAYEAQDWFTFFHSVAVTDGLAWSSGSYVPVMAGNSVLRSTRLADSDVDATPDLAAISTSVTSGDTPSRASIASGGTARGQKGPALLFRTDHPYATGFTVTEGTVSEEKTETFLELDQPLPLAGDPGERRLTIATTTPYGTLAPHHLHYRTS